MTWCDAIPSCPSASIGNWLMPYCELERLSNPSASRWNWVVPVPLTNAMPPTCRLPSIIGVVDKTWPVIEILDSQVCALVTLFVSFLCVELKIRMVSPFCRTWASVTAAFSKNTGKVAAHCGCPFAQLDNVQPNTRRTTANKDRISSGGTEGCRTCRLRRGSMGLFLPGNRQPQKYWQGLWSSNVAD